MKLLRGQTRHWWPVQSGTESLPVLCRSSGPSHCSLVLHLKQTMSASQRTSLTVCTYSSTSASLHNVMLQFKDSVTASRFKQCLKAGFTGLFFKKDFIPSRAALHHQSFPGGSVVINPLASAEDTGDTGLIPGLGRSPGEGNDNPFQYSCLGQRSLVGYSPWGLQRVRHNLETKQQQQIFQVRKILKAAIAVNEEPLKT